MSRITKKEWEIIIDALAHFEVETFENVFPNLSKDNEEQYDKAKAVYTKLKRKVWDKIND